MLEKHFASEVNQNFEQTIATFAGSPRYEIMPTGQIYEGEEAVINYHRIQRTAFPDQRHENVRFHFADDHSVISEFNLLGTNLGEFMGFPPTGKAFCVPTIAVFSFEDDKIVCERVYLDTVTLLSQIDRLDVLASQTKA